MIDNFDDMFMKMCDMHTHSIKIIIKYINKYKTLIFNIFYTTMENNYNEKQ